MDLNLSADQNKDQKKSLDIDLNKEHVESSLPFSDENSSHGHQPPQSFSFTTNEVEGTIKLPPKKSSRILSQSKNAIKKIRNREYVRINNPELHLKRLKKDIERRKPLYANYKQLAKIYGKSMVPSDLKLREARKRVRNNIGSKEDVEIVQRKKEQNSFSGIRLREARERVRNNIGTKEDIERVKRKNEQNAKSKRKMKQRLEEGDKNDS